VGGGQSGEAGKEVKGVVSITLDARKGTGNSEVQRAKQFYWRAREGSLKKNYEKRNSPLTGRTKGGS